MRWGCRTRSRMRLRCWMPRMRTAPRVCCRSHSSCTIRCGRSMWRSSTRTTCTLPTTITISACCIRRWTILRRRRSSLWMRCTLWRTSSISSLRWRSRRRTLPTPVSSWSRMRRRRRGRRRRSAFLRRSVWTMPTTARRCRR